jgi:hypothetical protein
MFYATKRILSVFVSLITISLTAEADTRIAGHMEPLDHELLSPEIRLDCGVVVRERQGKPVSVEALNNMCTYALRNFPKFVEEKKLRTNRNTGAFSWSLSILPESHCYRCLNDVKYRFRYRMIKADVIGYTEKNARYSFILNDESDKVYNVTFVHEMFHAMSMFYGVYDNHPGNWGQKTERDERLAKEFTNWLGYR